MLTVRELLEMFDNWNGVTKINDDKLKMIAKDTTWHIAENEELAAEYVVSFGFYDGEFCIRVKRREYRIYHSLFGKSEEVYQYEFLAKQRCEWLNEHRFGAALGKYYYKEEI